jgi:hypothetical protein
MIAVIYVARSRFHCQKLALVLLWCILPLGMYLMTAHETIGEQLTFCGHIRKRVFRSCKSGMHIKIVMFKNIKPCLQGVRHVFHKLISRLRRTRRFWSRRKRIPMDQCMARSSPLDLAQSNKISSFEVPITLPEFPKRGVRSSGVEYITNYGKVSPIHLIVKTKAYAYLYGIHTCSAGAQMRICLYA